MWQSLEVLNVFNTLTFKQIFWKMKKNFNRFGCGVLVESTKIENATFSYKTTQSNIMEITKRSYHKEFSFCQ